MIFFVLYVLLVQNSLKQKEKENEKINKFIKYNW